VPRLGAVDLGTNATRLLVADVEGGAVTALVRRERVTRLGEGVDSTRRLKPEAIARVFAVLERYREELGDAPSVAVGTSAVRDAADGPDFLRQVEERFSFETRLLSGDEEAQLTRLGVGATGEAMLILDVGGGSTELIAGEFHTSLDVGSVRLAERFDESLDDGAAFVDSLLPPLEVDSCIGVGGTVAQLQLLAGELTLEAVEAQLDYLASVPLDERRRVPNLDPDRAPVIVTGALIVRQVLRRYRLDRLAYSERDLLDGVLIRASRASATSRRCP
jgi:exopolyphosphatase / guanosine-5'-triphosphate,3'-diphosphate pyrophosphatase